MLAFFYIDQKFNPIQCRFTFSALRFPPLGYGDACNHTKNNKWISSLSELLYPFNKSWSSRKYLYCLTSEGIVGCVHFTIVLFWIVLTGALDGGNLYQFHCGRKIIVNSREQNLYPHCCTDVIPHCCTKSSFNSSPILQGEIWLLHGFYLW